MDIRTQRLNEAFNASGLTQTELCEKTGLTKGAISSYLSGRYFPKQKATEALAEALNVSIPYLMGYEEEPSPVEDKRQEMASDNPKLRALLQAGQKLSPEDLDFAIEWMNRMANK